MTTSQDFHCYCLSASIISHLDLLQSPVSALPLFPSLFSTSPVLLKHKSALVGVVQWVERWPVNRRVAIQYPVRAHAWVAGQVPSRGHSRGNHTLMFLSLPLFPSLKLNNFFLNSHTQTSQIVPLFCLKFSPSFPYQRAIHQNGPQGLMTPSPLSFSLSRLLTILYAT